MSDQSDPGDRLEALVGQALRDLPRLRAPVTLERRVHDELERRGERAAWQRGFSHWSMTTRISFVCISLAAMLSLLWVGAGIGDFSALLIARVPTTWLYVALGAGALLYATLFGLGATAYRTLYQQPSDYR